MKKIISVKRSKIEDETSTLTKQLSYSAREISLGLLALITGILVNNNTKLDLLECLRIGIIVILVLLLDCLQYYSGYYDLKRYENILRKHPKKKSVSYDPESVLVKVRYITFHGKQLLLGIAVLWFCLAVVRVFL